MSTKLMEASKDKTLKVLERARELLDAPGAWTKGQSARDADDNPTGTFDCAACSFCTVGALSRAAHEVAGASNRGATSGTLYHTAAQALKGEEHVVLPAWNDHYQRQHIDVLCAFDLAILRTQEGLA